MAKVKYLIPSDAVDLWRHVPAVKLANGGIWSRKRLVRGPTGQWQGSGRITKIYYKC